MHSQDPSSSKSKQKITPQLKKLDNLFKSWQSKQTGALALKEKNENLQNFCHYLKTLKVQQEKLDVKIKCCLQHRKKFFNNCSFSVEDGKQFNKKRKNLEKEILDLNNLLQKIKSIPQKKSFIALQTNYQKTFNNQLKEIDLEKLKNLLINILPKLKKQTSSNSENIKTLFLEKKDDLEQEIIKWFDKTKVFLNSQEPKEIIEATKKELEKQSSEIKQKFFDLLGPKYQFSPFLDFLNLAKLEKQLTQINERLLELDRFIADLNIKEELRKGFEEGNFEKNAFFSYFSNITDQIFLDKLLTIIDKRLSPLIFLKNTEQSLSEEFNLALHYLDDLKKLNTDPFKTGLKETYFKNQLKTKIELLDKKITNFYASKKPSLRKNKSLFQKIQSFFSQFFILFSDTINKYLQELRFNVKTHLNFLHKNLSNKL